MKSTPPSLGREERFDRVEQDFSSLHIRDPSVDVPVLAGRDPGDHIEVQSERLLRDAALRLCGARRRKAQSDLDAPWSETHEAQIASVLQLVGHVRCHVAVDDQRGWQLRRASGHDGD